MPQRAARAVTTGFCDLPRWGSKKRRQPQDPTGDNLGKRDLGQGHPLDDIRFTMNTAPCAQILSPLS
jgi:hypothetical protein